MAGRSKKADEALIPQLAAGRTVDSAAQLAGMSRATAFRRLQDPDFKRRVSDTRAALFDRAAGRLSAGACKASKVLSKLLGSASEKIQLTAAKIILELGIKVRDVTELEQRLSALEKLVAQQRKSRP